jgi:hypothetical protein
MRFKENIFQTTFVRYICAAIVIFFFSLAVGRGLLSSNQRLSDFAGYYTAASIVAHGDSILKMYDDAWFKEQVKHLGLQDTGMVMYVNPPPVSLVMVPLVGVEPSRAKLTWNIFNIILLIVIWVIALQCFDISWRSFYGIALFGLLASTLPFLRNIQRGQMYISLLLLVILLWRALTKNNAWQAGIALSLLLLLKYFGWMLVPFLVVQRKWKEVIITLCCVIAGTIVTMVIVGPETYLAHFARLGRAFSMQDAFITGLPCVPALFGKLFVYHPQWNLHPIIDAPWLATLLTVSILIVMMGISLQRTSRSFLQSFYSLIVVGVLFTPLAAEHHFVLLSIPFFICVANQRWNTKPLSYALPMLALGYMIFGWFPSVPPNMFNGWMQLLAFPRLYGGMILWIVLVFSKTSPVINVTTHETAMAA